MQSFYYYHDKNHNEIDLLIQHPEYFEAIEIKSSITITNDNRMNFRSLEKVSNLKVKHKAIISNAKEYYKQESDVKVVPVWYI
jgi:predicted AAA+ superfamily ATPase